MRTIALAIGLAAAAIPAGATAQTMGEACQSLISTAEQRYNIPTGLLMAIALTESGDKTGGPNPHAMNIAGMTYIAPNIENMAGVIQRGYNTGQTSIDVGCMQVNLKYHAHNFRSPYELLNSRVNVDYGARYLASLANDTKSWRDAVMTYHNAKNPARRAWYGCNVWNNYLRVHRAGQGYMACGKANGSSTASTMAPVRVAAATPRSAPQVPLASPGPLSGAAPTPAFRTRGSIAIVGEGEALPEITQQDANASAFRPIRPIDWAERLQKDPEAEPDRTDPDDQPVTDSFGRVTRTPKN